MFVFFYEDNPDVELYINYMPFNKISRDDELLQIMNNINSSKKFVTFSYDKESEFIKVLAFICRFIESKPLYVVNIHFRLELKSVHDDYINPYMLFLYNYKVLRILIEMKNNPLV